jgi:glycosyltransferase involved in cell wall biosynthesis
LIADGVDGLLVPPEDASALASAITALADQPERAAALSVAGRARFATEFAEAPVMARWRSLLQAIAPVGGS